MYDIVVEGFQLLSRWTARIWEQCAWKFSRPSKDVTPSVLHETLSSLSDYEKVERFGRALNLLIPFFFLIIKAKWQITQLNANSN